MPSFDPLGIVKAMGAQRDPYSWAETYNAQAEKKSLLLKQMEEQEIRDERKATRADERLDTRLTTQGRLAENLARLRHRQRLDQQTHKAGLSEAGREEDVMTTLRAQGYETTTLDALKEQAKYSGKSTIDQYEPVQAGKKTIYVRRNPEKGPIALPPRRAEAPASRSQYRSSFDDDDD